MSSPLDGFTQEQIDQANKAADVLRKRLLAEIETAKKNGILKESANAMKDLYALALNLSKTLAIEMGLPESQETIYGVFVDLLKAAAPANPRRRF